MTPDELFLLFQLLQQILGVANSISQGEQTQAVESNPFRIQTAAELAYGYVKDPVVGLPNLFAAIQNVRLDTGSPHLATLTDVLDAIAALTPVTLPVDPPPGYGFGDFNAAWGVVFGTYAWCEED